MNRPADVHAGPQIRHRKLFADMVHPLFDAPLPAETGPAPFRNIPPQSCAPRRCRANTPGRSVRKCSG